MTIRKLLSLFLALALALGCAGALAEDDDLQGQLDAANERIAELQAQVDTYYPYYIAQIVAEFSDGTVVLLSDVQEQYNMINNQYQNMYGFTLEALGIADTVKRDLVDSAVEEAILLKKAEENGLDQLDEETIASIDADAEAQLESYVKTYTDYFYADQEVTDDMRAEAVQYWSDNGVTKELIADSFTRNAVIDAAREFATGEVVVTEEDVQAAYDALVASNQISYANDSTYNSDRNSGVPIAWNPEGYRAVKQVLIQFDEDQANTYSELQAQLDSLNDEREAIENPTEGADTSAMRTLEEVDADIADCGAEIENLYAELMPEAQEVVDAFNAGTDFDALIEQYNDDPGMKNEPTASQGYAVCAGSTAWDPAFTEGAMSISEVGAISEPQPGSNGLYIIYYMADIQPGPVDLESIRDAMEEDAMEQKRESAYEAQLAAWIEEAGVVYHYESFGISTGVAAPDEAADETADTEEAADEAETADTEEAADEAETADTEEAADEAETADTEEAADEAEAADETAGEVEASGADEAEAAVEAAGADEAAESAE